MFANSWPSTLNFKSFSRSLEQFFLTDHQNNFKNKIPLMCILLTTSETSSKTINFFTIFPYFIFFIHQIKHPIMFDLINKLLIKKKTSYSTTCIFDSQSKTFKTSSKQTKRIGIWYVVSEFRISCWVDVFEQDIVHRFKIRNW